MRVRDVVGAGRRVITIDAEAPVSQAIQLLLTHGIGALPVVNADSAPIGILSERDIVRALHELGEGVRAVRVGGIMRRPPPSCALDDSLHDVTARMTRERARHLVVRDGGTLAAVLSVGDLVKHRLEQLQTEAGVLRDYVAGQRARV